MAKCFFGTMQDFFPWLAESIAYNCLNQDNQEEGRGDSQIPPTHSANDCCNNEDRCQPLQPRRVQMVRSFSPVQQCFGINSHTGIFPEYRQILAEIELIA